MKESGRAIFAIAGCALFSMGIARADDSRRAVTLQAEAVTDSEEVHPDSVFEVTVSLKNVGDSPQEVKIPECAWDRVWRSSNRHVTWDFWDCDDDNEITVTVPPHGSYEFPKPLRMFVDESAKAGKVDFRMGFKTKAFGKTIWASPITLDVVP
jgi:hypothetical protein